MNRSSYHGLARVAKTDKLTESGPRSNATLARDGGCISVIMMRWRRARICQSGQGRRWFAAV